MLSIPFGSAYLYTYVNTVSLLTLGDLQWNEFDTYVQNVWGGGAQNQVHRSGPGAVNVLALLTLVMNTPIGIQL